VSGDFEVDPDAVEIRGPTAAVEGLLDEARAVDEAIAAAGLTEHAARYPLFGAAVAAARTSRFRIRTDGAAPATTVRGDACACLVVTEHARGRSTAIGVAAAEAPLALWTVVGLGPRPRPDGPPIVLSPGAMALMIGRGRVHGHGLDAAVAAALEQRLAAAPRHWAVQIAWQGLDGAERRRNLEVLEGEAAGIWRLRALDDERVEMAPTTSTAVLRDMIALVALGL
jgi:hypothetical protein